jgi:hypothetical protein
MATGLYLLAGFSTYIPVGLRDSAGRTLMLRVLANQSAKISNTARS